MQRFQRKDSSKDGCGDFNRTDLVQASPRFARLLVERIAVVYVDELAADRKFVFLSGSAYKRILMDDEKVL